MPTPGDGRSDRAFRGLDDRGRYVAQVVRYDQPDGWVAFVRQRRVPGVVHQNVATAQALAEVGLELLDLA